MRKCFTVFLLLSFAVAAFAADGAKKQMYKVDRSKKPAVIGTEPLGVGQVFGKRNSGRSTSAIGPGQFIMQSTYDYVTNGGVPHHLFYVAEENVLVFARMGATDAGTADRGSWWALNDGSGWTTPIKVEVARRGWTDLSHLSDWSSVISCHTGGEVNVEQGFGLGVFTSTSTGQPASGTWPRNAVTGGDNIVVVTTRNGETVSGTGSPKSVATSTDRGATWTVADLLPTTPGSFGADDQAIDAWGDKVAVAVSDFGGDIHLWESADGGMTWAYRNVTSYPAIAIGDTVNRTFDTCDVLYDNDGNLHIFWESVQAVGEADTTVSLFLTTTDGIRHWSEASGESQVVAFADVPGAASDNIVFAAGGVGDQVDADGILTFTPQGAVDAEGNIYVVFTSYRPNDIDAADSTHFCDIYAVGSDNGGASWGAVVNLTDTPQSEDMWASVYDVVDDSIRFIYSSDGSTGGLFQGGGTEPANYMYYAVHKSSVPVGTAVAERPGNGIPTSFALHQNFPNPFNPSTTITFDLVKPAKVKLSIYDVNGKLIATLVNAQKSAGTHEVTWNAAKNQASGVYFSKLEADGVSSVKKMILTK